jgi:hypothetical protein
MSDNVEGYNIGVLHSVGTEEYQVEVIPVVALIAP